MHAMFFKLYIVDVRDEASIAAAANGVNRILLPSASSPDRSGEGQGGDGRDTSVGVPGNTCVGGPCKTHASDAWGPLDVLLNCAGVASCSPLELTTTAEFQSVRRVGSDISVTETFPQGND